MQTLKARLSLFMQDCRASPFRIHKQSIKKRKSNLSIFCGKIPQELLQLQDFAKIKKGAAYTWSLNTIIYFLKNKRTPLLR